MQMDWFLGVIRGLFAAIDKVVVWLIENLYNLIFQISSVQIFDNASLAAFANRITVILSIFMIFKLSLSFLNYIVNPDAMTDKSKGFSKLIQNIAVALVLLVSYQFLFDKAMELQQKIVDNNTVPKLILGSSGKNVKNSGVVSFPLFSAFIVPNSDLLAQQQGCRTYFINDGTVPHKRCDIGDYSSDAATMPNIGNEPNNQLDYTVENQNTYYLFDYLLRLKNNGQFAFDYKFIISTICGAFAALVLLSFCMDVAVRIIKLYFLRLIAPIPIISYIDPIKGEGIFKKWLSNVGKTYADLFVRLIAIFFAIFIIQQVSANAGTLKDFNGNPIDNPFVIIFIIIGALMFAKQFPKLIQDITGISLDGKMQLNPFKKVSEQALGGKAMVAGAAGAVGAGMAGVTNFGHRFASGIKNGQGFKGKVLGGLKGAGKGTLSGIAGAASAGRRAFGHSMKGDGFLKSAWAGDQEAMFAKLQREDLERQGSTLSGRVKADMARRLGILNAGQEQIIRAGQMDNTIENRQAMIDAKKQKVANLKQQHLDPFTSYSNVVGKMENLVDKNSKVKAAKSRYDAIAATNGQSLIEQANSKYNAVVSKADERVTHAKEKLDTLKKNGASAVEINQAQNQLNRAKGAYDQTKLIAEKERDNVITSVNDGTALKNAFAEYSGVRTSVANDMISNDDNMKALVERANDIKKNEIDASTVLSDDEKKKAVYIGEDGFKSATDSRKDVDNYTATYELTDTEYLDLNSEIAQAENEIKNIKTDNASAYMALVQDGIITGTPEFNEAYKNYQKAVEDKDVTLQESYHNEMERIAKDVAQNADTEYNYKYVHDAKSKERADNAARSTKAPQSEGWTPNPQRVDTRTYMENSVGGSGPLGGLTGRPPHPHNNNGGQGNNP
jgi:hypothetical protein